jgi:hypothetical protein
MVTRVLFPILNTKTNVAFFHVEGKVSFNQLRLYIRFGSEAKISEQSLVTKLRNSFNPTALDVKLPARHHRQGNI